MDSPASKIHVNLDLNFIGFATGHPILIVLADLARHSGSHWCFQFPLNILNGFLEFLVLRVNEINSL